FLRGREGGRGRGAGRAELDDEGQEKAPPLVVPIAERLECCVSYPRKPTSTSACCTRARIAAGFIGKARKKSSRVSAALRSRTLAAQNDARVGLPFRACAAAAIIAISACAPGERAPRSAHCAAPASSPRTMCVNARVASIA